MGISVIPALPKGITSQAPSSNGGSPKDLLGDFASLLSKELLSSKALTPETSAEKLNFSALKIKPESASQEKIEAPIDQTGLQILASLAGNPATQPETMSHVASDLAATAEILPNRELKNLAGTPYFRKDGSDESPRETLYVSEKFTFISDTRDGNTIKSSTSDTLATTAPIENKTLSTAGPGQPPQKPTILDPSTTLTVLTPTSAPTSPEPLNLKPITSGTSSPLETIALTPTPPGQFDTKPPTATAFNMIEKPALVAMPAEQNSKPINPTTALAVETNASPLPNANIASAIARPAGEALITQQPNITTHLRESNWPQQFGEKIVWLVKNDQQTAQININPRELGPVQITLSLNGDQAKLAFSSPHAEVRQAIESSLPQLKDMLSATGINLGQTNVGANSGQNNPDNPYQSANGKRLADENAILRANDKVLSTGTSSVLQRGRGLVDLFA